MKVVLNYRKGNPRLREGIEAAGHEVRENVWDADAFFLEGIDAAVFEFKYIFKKKWEFLSLARALKRHDIPVITWNVDAPWNAGISKWKANLLLKSTLLSIYATHSLQDTDWIKARVVYLPNAVWSSKYNLRSATLDYLRRPDIYRWDVSFIGNIDKERYPEHRTRVEFLEDLGSHLKMKGINFLFTDSKGISFDEQVEIIQRSKINLSCTSASDSRYGYSWGLSERCYGIPACGGFLLMEDRVHARDDFDIGDSVATYSGIEDCMDKISYYLERQEERRTIAEKMHAKVMKKHTYQHRAVRLISEIQKIKSDVALKIHQKIIYARSR